MQHGQCGVDGKGRAGKTRLFCASNPIAAIMKLPILLALRETDMGMVPGPS